MLFSVIFILSFLGGLTATDSPIFGILSQETYIVDKYLPEKHKSFIAASYVKYLESAGARVVPIRIGEDNDYYRHIVNYTNGILFPGGGTYFNESGGYGDAAKEIYKWALTLNQQGTYYPLWGTCLGMQALVYAAKGEDIRTNCELHKAALPLNLSPGYENSKLFNGATKEIVDILSTKNVTYNYHRYCFTKEVLERNGLLSQWNILSTNIDSHDNEFISTLEHKTHPFYGVQFHPEKNVFEFKQKMGIPHSVDAVKVSQYFANFLVNEGRKNNNRWPSTAEETQQLIYNYNPIFTGLKNSSYEQTYVFD